MLEFSVMETPGHLRAHYNNSIDFDEYDTKNKKWTKTKIQPLAQCEKSALIWSKQGMNSKQIADKMNVSHQTVLNIFHSIYQKLGVHTITQAINIPNILHLIFMPKHQKNEKAEDTPVVKKQRRVMTSEKLRRIQDALNKGKSVNSIAKQENVGEWTIRYAIEVSKKLLKIPK